MTIEKMDYPVKGKYKFKVDNKYIVYCCPCQIAMNCIYDINSNIIHTDDSSLKPYYKILLECSKII